MNSTLVNIGLILLFTVVGGVFAAAEMSLVSLRESQVKSLSHRGSRGQKVARLAANPNRFLSAVQIGVTLAGFLSAAFGAATLADDLSPVLQSRGVPAGVADTLALVAITIVISYLSIVLGELTAKRLALQRAEGFALALAPLVDLIATLARPVIWLLGASTNVAVRLLGGDPKASREEVTDEEIRAMVSTSVTLGAEERRIVDEVFSAGERSLREVMVPRTEVDFLAGDMPVSRAVREVRDAPHSRYPVTAQSTDDVVGFVHVRDLFDPGLAGRASTVQQLVRPVISLPDTVRMLPALTEMRRRAAHLAVVRDEYGGTAGIVTMEDLVEELVGDITDEYDVVVGMPAPAAGELDGLTTLEEFTERHRLVLDEGPYDTVAGWFMARLGRLPLPGDELEVELRASDAGEDEPGHAVRFQVLELDGRRAARFRVTVGARPATPATPGS
nr:hemolysin family protein [Desertihabitans aurantiacus]